MLNLCSIILDNVKRNEKDYTKSKEWHRHMDIKHSNDRAFKHKGIAIC